MDNRHRGTMRALEALIKRMGENDGFVALCDADTGLLATKAGMVLCRDTRTEISGNWTEVEVLRGDIEMLRWMKVGATDSPGIGAGSAAAAAIRKVGEVRTR